MNPITSPSWMAWLNAASVVYGTLETTGVINMLGSRAGYAMLIGGALNGIAHAFSPPTPGPLASINK